MASPHVLVLQHVDVEGPALIGDVLQKRGVALRVIGPRDAAPLGVLDGAAGLVVMGGPMGVYEADRHPRLLDELALIRAALERDLPMLGVCLGSQLLAAALGARVAPGPRKELGWFEVELGEAAREDALFGGAPGRFTALHWHGDVFELPRGAVALGRSAATEHQAFAVGRAYGILFHLEAGRAEVEGMASAFPHELVEVGTTREALLAATDEHVIAARAVGRGVFERWAELLAP